MSKKLVFYLKYEAPFRSIMHPVIASGAFSARYAASTPTSSGLAIRPSGCCSSTSEAPGPAMTALAISVSTHPGAMV